MFNSSSSITPVSSADSTDNVYMRDVVGNKSDAAAAGAVSTTESLMAYAKQNVTAGIALDGFHDVPSADSADNAQMRDVLGNKTDTTAGNSAVALLKQLITATGQVPVTKALTFSNDTGTVNLFTVTGDVHVEIVAVCKTNVASAAAGNIRLGVSGNDEAMISDTLATDLDANEFWNDNSPTSNIQAADRVRSYDISNGDDVILTLDAQVDSGAITFYCRWWPWSSDGNVVAA